MTEGFLNLGPIVGAFGAFGQSNARLAALAERRRARRQNRFSTFGTLAGAVAGGFLAAPTGGVSIPVGASLGATAGGVLGRSAGGGPAPSATESLNIGLGLANAQSQGARQDALNTIATQAEGQPAATPQVQGFLSAPAAQPTEAQIVEATEGRGLEADTPPLEIRGALSLPQRPSNLPVPGGAGGVSPPVSNLPVRGALSGGVDFRQLGSNLIRAGEIGPGVRALSLSQQRGQAQANIAQLQGIQQRVDQATTGDLPSRLGALRQGRSEALQLGTGDGRALAKQFQTEIDSSQSRALQITSDPFTREAVKQGMTFPLSGEDIAKVESAIQTQQTQQTTETTTARIGAEIEVRLDAPIGNDLAQKLGVPLGTTAREAQGQILEDPADLKPDQRKAIAESAAVRGAAENLVELFDPSFVGPVAGRRLAIAATIGFDPATGEPITPRQAEFVASGNQLTNRVIRAITGAQVGQGGETRRIMGEIPNIKDPPTVWQAKLKTTLENIERLEAIAAQKTVSGARAAAGGTRAQESDTQRRARLNREFGLQ